MTFNPLTDITWKAAVWAEDPAWVNPGDGGAVTSLRDAGSAASNLAGTGTYIASSQLGGRPGIRMIGNPIFDGFATSGAWGSAITGTIGIFIVTCPSWSTNLYQGFSDCALVSEWPNSGPKFVGASWPAAGTGLGVGYAVWSYTRSGIVVKGDVLDTKLAPTAPHILYYEIPTGVTSGFLNVDGRNVFASNVSNGSNTWSGLRLNHTGASNDYLNQDMAFVGVKDGALTGPELAAIQAWASDYYSIPLMTQGPAGDIVDDPGKLAIPYAPGFQAPATIKQIRNAVGTFDTTLPAADLGPLYSDPADPSTQILMQPPGNFGGFPGAWDRLLYFSLPHGTSNPADGSSEPPFLPSQNLDTISINKNSPPMIQVPNNGAASVNTASFNIPGNKLVFISAQVNGVTLSSVSDNTGGAITWNASVGPNPGNTRWAYVSQPLTGVVVTATFSGTTAVTGFSDQGSVKVIVFDGAAARAPSVQSFTATFQALGNFVTPTVFGEFVGMHAWVTGTSSATVGRFVPSSMQAGNSVVEFVAGGLPSNDRAAVLTAFYPVATKSSTAFGTVSTGTTSSASGITFEVYPAPAMAQPVMVPPYQFGIGSMTMPSQLPQGNDSSVVSDGGQVHINASGTSPTGDMELYIDPTSPAAFVVPPSITSYVVPTMTIPPRALCVLFNSVYSPGGSQTITFTQSVSDPVQLPWDIARGYLPTAAILARSNAGGVGTAEIWWSYNNTDTPVTVNLTATFLLSTGPASFTKAGFIAPVYFMNAYPSLDFSGYEPQATNGGGIGVLTGTTLSSQPPTNNFVMAGGTSQMWCVLQHAANTNVDWSQTPAAGVTMWTALPVTFTSSTNPGSPGGFVAYQTAAVHPTNPMTKVPNVTTGFISNGSSGRFCIIEIRSKSSGMPPIPQAPGPFSVAGSFFQTPQPASSEASDANLVVSDKSMITIDSGSAPTRIFIRTDTTSITTEPFTVQPGALILSFTDMVNGTTGSTITSTTGGGLTWTRRVAASGASYVHDIYGAYNNTGAPITMSVTTNFPAVATTSTRSYIGTNNVYILYGANPTTAQGNSAAGINNFSVTPTKDHALVFTMISGSIQPYNVTPLSNTGGYHSTFGSMTSPGLLSYPFVTSTWLYNSGDEIYNVLQLQPGASSMPSTQITCFFMERAATAVSVSWSTAASDVCSLIVYAADEAPPIPQIGPGSFAFGKVKSLQQTPEQQRIAEDVRVYPVVKQETLDLSYWRGGEILGYV